MLPARHHPRSSMSLDGFSKVARAFSHRNYAIYAAGSCLSLIGKLVQMAAVGWLTWRLTGSVTWVSIMAVADMGPSLLSPIGGVFADRLNKQWMFFWLQAAAMGQAIALSVLTLTGLITVEILFALTLVLGTLMAFSHPVRMALIPSLVAREDLPTAIALTSVVFNIAMFVGGGIGGFIIAMWSVGAAFLFNAVCFLGVLGALASLRLPREVRRVGRQTK
ncbi:MAG: MFS transporter, partial [Pseudomonadota bacterium]